MPARDFGNKFVCFKCSTKFYDMKKPDPLCPKCGSDQRQSPANKPASEGRRGRLAAVPKAAPAPVQEEEMAAKGDDDEESLEEFEDEDLEEAAGDDEDEP